MINIKLLNQAIEWITSNPNQWSQLHWHCGTTHCIAGIVQMLVEKEDPSLEYSGSNIFTKDVAQKNLGLSDSQAEYLFMNSRTLLNLSDTASIWAGGVPSSNSDDLAIALCPSLSPELMTKLTISDDLFARKEMAERTDLPLTLINSLSEDKSESVRESIARRIDLPSTIVSKLASDEDFRVRREIANQANLSLELIDQLSVDLADTVRRVIFKRSDISAEYRDNIFIRKA